jgi:acetyl-CoA C-acetyltransferase
MVTGIGMHMTKHVAAVWSTEPGTLHHPHDHGPQWWSEPDGVAGATDRPVVAALSGPVRVLAASVVHEPGVDPCAVAICERDDGARGYARSSAPDVVAAVAEDAWVGATAVTEPRGEINELKL